MSEPLTLVDVALQLEEAASHYAPDPNLPDVAWAFGRARDLVCDLLAQQLREQARNLLGEGGS